MAEKLSAAQKTIGDFAPKLVELTDEVLFGDIWERPGLSKRDRSQITVGHEREGDLSEVTRLTGRCGSRFRRGEGVIEPLEVALGAQQPRNHWAQVLATSQARRTARSPALAAHSSARRRSP